ncbi:MAG: zinc ribbon domain-containing protein [Burkholderiaceae bacterium]|nr:zinc ribbon domain-containing protein [Burkholderiaceae bacterium]
MLKHKCTECGKRLSESATVCPKCGAPKPVDGWGQVSPVFRFLITAGIVVLCLAGAYTLFAVYLEVTGYGSPKPYVVLKPGMSFDFTRAADFACTSKESLTELAKSVQEGDKAKFAHLLTVPGEYGWCREMKGTRFEVDDIIKMEGVGDVVAFYQFGDSKEKFSPFYTPRSNVRPWDYIPPTPLYPQISATDLRKGQEFTVNNTEFVACESKEDLAKYGEYLAKSDTENANALFSNRPGDGPCFRNDQIFPDEKLVLLRVEKDERHDVNVVAFHRTSFASANILYTLIEFVPPYTSSTPSAAN